MTVSAFVLRVGYLWFARRGACGAEILVEGCPGDSWFYHNAANLLADGRGFISPVHDAVSNGRVQFEAADHPPLLTVLLSGFSLIGLTSWLAHQFVMILIGTASVVVAGLAGRDVFGSRVGLLAALLVAVNPNVWVNDGNVLSESPAILIVLLTTWTAYRFWREPSVARAAVVGALIGMGMLARPEMGMLLVLVVAPLAFRSRILSIPQRLVRVGTAGAVAFLVVSPWVALNLSRFDRPVTLSTGFGITLANTNCDITYYGDRIGYWSPLCIPEIPRSAGLDQSEEEAFLRRTALDYIESHKRRFPVVVAARIGRMWNLFRPFQQIQLDFYEGRPVWANRLALLVFYPTILLTAYGVLVTARRGIPVMPLLGPIIMVTASAVITFGHARYRAPAEGTLCLLAAVGIDGLVGAVRHRPQRGHRAPAMTAAMDPAKAHAR